LPTIWSRADDAGRRGYAMDPRERLGDAHPGTYVWDKRRLQRSQRRGCTGVHFSLLKELPLNFLDPAD